MSSRLAKAVEGWIEAEWQFRFGEECYSLRTQQLLEMAEDGLREVLTGRHDLGRARRWVSHKRKARK